MDQSEKIRIKGDRYDITIHTQLLEFNSGKSSVLVTQTILDKDKGISTTTKLHQSFIKIN